MFALLSYLKNANTEGQMPNDTDRNRTGEHLGEKQVFLPSETTVPWPTQVTLLAVRLMKPRWSLDRRQYFVRANSRLVFGWATKKARCHLCDTGLSIQTNEVAQVSTTHG